MPNLDMEGDMKELLEGHKRHLHDWEEWERTRLIKLCKCGNVYSYGKGDVNPGKCPACRGKLGDLVY